MIGKRSAGCGDEFAAVIADDAGDDGWAGGRGIGHSLDDSATDHGAVSNVSQSGEMLRLGDAKTDADRPIGQALDLRMFWAKSEGSSSRAPVMPETER